MALHQGDAALNLSTLEPERKAGLTLQQVAEHLLITQQPRKAVQLFWFRTLLKHFHFYPNQYKWSHPFQTRIIWLQLKLRSVILNTWFLRSCSLVALPRKLVWILGRCCRTHWGRAVQDWGPTSRDCPGESKQAWDRPEWRQALGWF